MNYLAHLSLSFKDEDLMLGNLVADFTRKAKFKDYQPRVQLGIELHHFIDDYTDSHSLVDEAKSIIRSHQGKFSGVVMDIYFDHLLAKEYNAWHEESLFDFACDSYALFNRRKKELPQATLHMLHYMEQGNWLYNYSSHQGLSRSLEGMSRRTRYPNNMHLAADFLQERELAIARLFKAFYADLQASVNQWREEVLGPV